MEQNTYATSNYIDASVVEVERYLSDGMNLNEYTLFSRMNEQIDETTWLGTASGYQAGLYYHVKRRQFGSVRIVEWHCGARLGTYFHVYPMLLFPPEYFGGNDGGTYYHWISFVDPARRTPMIAQGLPTVHRAEARSLKSQLERRRGLRRPAPSTLELRSHSIYVDAPLAESTAYLGDPAASAEWGYLLRRERDALFDDYDHAIEIALTVHDLGEYRLIEHDTRYVGEEIVVRAPIVAIPASYAFAQPAATGFIMHRVSAWPVEGQRSVGKVSSDDYDTEAINAKRILENRTGNMAAYARGTSYVPPEV